MRAVLALALPFLGAISATATDLLRDRSLIAQGLDADTVQKRQGSPATGVLTDFEVYPPVLTPEGTKNQYGCIHTQTLMVHDFANSYGTPFVGNYTPPPCSFNRVTINFTVTSQGRQYDRLALMYLGSTEVWRTSTAEPTSQGIVWTYVKEMQQYNALWESPQTLIFDLGNLVNDMYTGIYHTTLTATFFTVPDSPATADQILPISKGLGSQGQASVFQVPSDNASVAYTLPKTVERAVVSLSACGQSGEEFWYTNVLDSDTQTFPDTAGTLPGGGPWREVQILIDGRLAGVAWPFATIFTGGIVPGFWRPIVGIDAFDLREREVDITPWLPLLLDGKAHRFEIRVAAVADDGHGHASVASVPTSYWLVTGKIFLFLNKSGKATTGTHPTVKGSGPHLQISSHLTKDAQGNNASLTYRTSAARSLSVSAVVNGRQASWSQDLSYSNYNALSDGGFTQVTTQSTSGSDRGAPAGYFAAYSFPISVNSSLALTSSGSVSSINGSLSRGFNFGVAGAAVFPSGVQPFNNSAAQQHQPLLFQPNAAQKPVALTLPASLPSFAGSVLNTTQTAFAEYFASAGGTSNQSYSFGTTNQTMQFAGLALQNGVSTELYSRDVSAVNTTIVKDNQVLLGHTYGGKTGVAGPLGQYGAESEGGRGPKSFVGKGIW